MSLSGEEEKARHWDLPAPWCGLVGVGGEVEGCMYPFLLEGIWSPLHSSSRG
jgi:hypothetical protein